MPPTTASPTERKSKVVDTGAWRWRSWQMELTRCQKQLGELQYLPVGSNHFVGRNPKCRKNGGWTPKMVGKTPRTMGYPTENDQFGVWNGGTTI